MESAATAVERPPRNGGKTRGRESGGGPRRSKGLQGRQKWRKRGGKKQRENPRYNQWMAHKGILFFVRVASVALQQSHLLLCSGLAANAAAMPLMQRLCR